eukprot:Sdes_comp19192_c0_seq1m10028
MLGPKPQQGSNRSGRRVKLRHSIFLNHRPKSAGLWMRGDPFKQNTGRTIRQGPIHHIRMPRDPAHIRSAEINIPSAIIKTVLERGRGIHHVATHSVNHALGLPSAATRVEHKERVFGIHPCDGTRFRCCFHLGIVPDVFVDVELVRLFQSIPQMFHHNAAVNRKAMPLANFNSLITNILQINRLRSSKNSISHHQHFRARGFDAARKRLGRKSCKHYIVNCPDARTGQERHRKLANHGQINRHRIALFHPFAFQHIGKLADLVKQLLIGHRLVAIHRISLTVEAHLVTKALLYMAIQYIVADTRHSPFKPPNKHLAFSNIIVVRQHLLLTFPLFLPEKFLRNLAPKLPGVPNRLLVHLFVRFHIMNMRRTRPGFGWLIAFINRRCFRFLRSLCPFWHLHLPLFCTESS